MRCFAHVPYGTGTQAARRIHMAMIRLHELVLDLEPPVTTDDGRLYRATVVAKAAPDGHWNAWLEFVGHGSQDVLRTAIETHQANEADLNGWSTTLSDVYLRGALERAQISRPETYLHRQATEIAAAPTARRAAKALDAFDVSALEEHVLRRELRLFRRGTLRSLIGRHHLNPRRVDVSTFTKAQLVAFIVTAAEVRRARALTRQTPARAK